MQLITKIFKVKAPLSLLMCSLQTFILLLLISPAVYADHYETLGVDRKATAQEIKAAYRSKARELMPLADRGDEQGLEAMKALNVAYDVLKDSNQRAFYDRGGVTSQPSGRGSYRGPQPGSRGRQTQDKNPWRNDFKQDWSGATSKSPYASSFDTLLDPKNFLVGEEGQANREAAIKKLEGLEWTEQAREDYLSRGNILLKNLKDNPDDFNAVWRITALMSSPLTAEFSELVIQALRLNKWGNQSAHHLIENKEFRKKTDFLNWMEIALANQGVDGYVGPALADSKPDANLAKALLLFIESMTHQSAARNLMMYIYQNGEQLEYYRPELRVFYRSEAFVSHFTWGTDPYGQTLLEMFRQDEPELTQAFEEGMKLKTPYDSAWGVDKVQQTLREYQAERLKKVSKALKKSEDSFQGWLATDPLKRSDASNNFCSIVLGG